MQTRHDVPEWITVGEAAALATVSVDTIRRWDKAGRIKSARTPTGHRRFRRADIEHLLQIVEDTESAAPAAMGGAA